MLRFTLLRNDQLLEVGYRIQKYLINVVQNSLPMIHEECLGIFVNIDRMSQYRSDSSKENSFILNKEKNPEHSMNISY